MKNRKLLLCFFFLFTVSLFAQDIPENGETPLIDASDTILSDEEETSEDITLTPEQQRIEMEIKTSTLTELAQWSRSLGLSESGTRAELSRRIRLHYELPEPRTQTNEDRKIITIESAQTSEYFTIEVTGEEYARLSGNVSISLKDDDTVHRISAGEILFNRTRNILSASGKVVYEKETGTSIETFRGESITVNIDDWSSIFLDGNSERKIDSEGTAYLFSGTVMSHTNEDVTILNKAVITNAANPEALWSISASKLWLLPGSDFAFVNAVLRVGEIPLLYIPAFYYPADEMIFHPVFGYRSREGGFVQTTTYIIGRPSADTTEVSSITKILGNTDDTEKEMQGLFLRSTGKRVENPDQMSLKAMFDYYVNLGTFFGAALYIPKTGILNPLNFSIGFGVTRTLTLTSFGHTPFAPDYDGTSDWNKSNLFSFNVPFRYRMEMQSSVTAEYGSLTWDLPYYSDPYVNRDFMIRSEHMDWIGMMQQTTTAQSNPAIENENESGTYQWHISGNLNPPVKILSPYVTRVSISDISTSLSFKTISDSRYFYSSSENPGRFFYAPNIYTIYNFSGSISGTPLTIDGKRVNSPAGTAPEIDDLFNGAGHPVSPWEDENPSDSSKEENKDEYHLIPPVLSQHFNIPTSGNLKFDINYQVSPAGATELQFSSGSWQAYDQVKWSEVRSILASFNGNNFINFRLNQSLGLFSNEVTFSGSGSWREYTYLNEEADIFLDSSGNTDQKRIESARWQQYSRTNYSTSYAYNGILRPLYLNDIFSQSNLQYTFKGTLVRSRRYSGAGGPELSPQWGSWVKEEIKAGEQIPGLNSHRIATNIAADVLDKQQNISFSIDIPPLDTLISTNAIFRFWISETRLNFRIRKQPEIPRIETERWIYEPVNFTETLRIRDFSVFTYYMVLTPEEDNKITTITTSLTLWSFKVSYKALYSKRYSFEHNTSGGGNWEQYGETALIPNELAFSYKREFQKIDIIKNRIDFSLDIDSSLTFDLQQYTNSNFQFQMGFRLGIAGFLDFRFTATSENNVVWRYFKGMPGMANLTSMYNDGPQNNVFTDLIDSFNFFNVSKRQRSGFKMKKFDLTFTHYLGDWWAELGISVYPYLNTGPSVPKYEAVSDISFVVKWKPISEIKTDVGYKGETDTWTRN